MQNKEYIEKIKRKFPLNEVIRNLDNLKKLKVLVIGDSIIDEYLFVDPKGRAIKDPILSLDFVRGETYLGGILEIANHIAGFVDELYLISLLGDYDRREDFIKTNLSKNIKTEFFTKKNSPTTNKKRFIDQVRNVKLFKVEYIDDTPIDKEIEADIVNHLKEELPKYDLVVVGDLGHGFITSEIIKILEENSKFLAGNVQTNSTNMGFNYITKYKRLDYLTSNEEEIRLALGDRFGNIPELIRKLKERTKLKNILLTRGKAGCVYIVNEHSHSSPSLTDHVKDVVGAGDAVFAITNLLCYTNVDEELLTFIANCVGALAVNVMDNKESISKNKLLDFIRGLE